MHLKYIHYNNNIQIIDNIIVNKCLHKGKRSFIKSKLLPILFACISIILLVLCFYKKSFYVIQNLRMYEMYDIMNSNFFSNFKIQKIQIIGNERISIEELLRAVDLEIGSNIFQISVHNIKSHLESLSWIKFATVEIQLPGTIILKIIERQSDAVWRNDDQFFLIDYSGFVITNHVTDIEKAKYIILFGKNANLRFSEIKPMLVKMKYYSSIASLHLVNNRRWDMFLTDGTIVKFPSDNIQNAIKILNNVRNIIKDPKIIDLRLAPKVIYIQPRVIQ